MPASGGHLACREPTLKDGTVLWRPDNRSIVTIVGIALKHHLEGAAFRELSTTKSLASIGRGTEPPHDSAVA